MKIDSKYFEKLKAKKKAILIALTLILSVVSVIAIIVNKGFYFAEFHEQTRISFQTEPSEETFNKLAELDNISRIDRTNNLIFVEYTNQEELTEDITALSIDTSTINISTIFQNQKFEFIEINLIIALVFAGAASLIINLFQLSNKKLKLNSDLAIKFSAIFIATYALSLLATFGTMSAVSRLYQVRFNDLFALVTTAIWVLFVLGYSSLNLVSNTTTANIQDNLISSSKSMIHNAVKLSAVVLAILCFALGVNYIMHAVFIFGGIVLSSIIYFSVLNTKFVIKINKKKLFKTKVKKTKPVSENKAKKKKKKK